jgi:probable DNA metabolism protein
MNSVEIPATFEGWRSAARELLSRGVPPARVAWRDQSREPELMASSDGRLEGLSAGRGGPAALPVPRSFLSVARTVACHRNPQRWTQLYRVLWRLTHGEPHLLAIVTDPDVHPLVMMTRAVRRSAHKMKAFVRFRAVAAATGDPAYLAWFEPAQLVVERTAPFFARRFPAMRWSILTPDRCAHWDRRRLCFGPGVTRGAAPTGDELEELWRAYYANIFNPARLNLTAMRAEMPCRYWHNLPEATAIGELTREAPRRTAAMLAQIRAAPEPLPDDLAPSGPLRPLRPEAAVESSAHPSRELDLPGEDARHDPGLSAARDRFCRAVGGWPSGDARQPTVSMPGVIGRTRIGVAGWSDPTLTRGQVFYPPGVEDAEARLRYYAARFSLVEVDATYYALPSRANAVAWAARTPPGFTFNVKAYGLLTGHGVDVRRLPHWLRRGLPRETVRRGRLYGRDLSVDLMNEVWRRFLGALEPLKAAGKLGAILLQYPRWFTPSRESADELTRARDHLGEVTGAVEFRHRHWLEPRLAARTLDLLRSLDLAYVAVDAPPGTDSSVPCVVAATSPRLAMLRLHGRRSATWEASNDPATERYRYLYDEAELAEHLQRVLDLSEAKANALHIVYNNCHGNYALTNAAELAIRLPELP